MPADPNRLYEFRCPVHGFIQVNEWEREIISHPAFQRLRRVRQLAWTDYVYPGAMHTRFEHSLGVMHVATLLYDAIIQRSRTVLEKELSYWEEGLVRDRQLVRLAALLHDVGHAPFSHASEELMPTNDTGEKYEHEDYSAAIIRTQLKDVIENHPLNINCDFKAEDVAVLLEGGSHAAKSLFWRDMISGQMDADRMDYLLRDSYHAGVEYGRFDLRRLIQTIEAIPGAEGSGPRFGVQEGGWHAAEGLVLARYFMFTQVYFHRTRVALNIHLQGALGELLPNGLFPKPIESEIDQYLKWDDWRVLGHLAAGEGGEHGKRIAERNHYREIYHTPEIPNQTDLEKYDEAKTKLGEMFAAERTADKSWYKTDDTDIPVVSGGGRLVKPLSEYSRMIESMPAIRKRMIFVKPEHAEDARRKLDNTQGGSNG